MNFEAPEFRRRTTSARSHAAAREENDTDRKPSRDIKRSILIFGLGALSWVATYVGMLELIEANMGDLPLVHRVIIGFSVAMLMTMIIWLLDQLFKPHTLATKLSYAGGYIFLSLISIGFGFGFYWKVLESRGEASRSAESAVSQVQNSLHAASTRLEQLQGNARATDADLDRQGRTRTHQGHVVPELEARRRPAPQNARGGCAALFVRVRIRQRPRRRRSIATCKP